MKGMNLSTTWKRNQMTSNNSEQICYWIVSSHSKLVLKKFIKLKAISL